ncbi:hypothetical protein [Listeria rustica]|uniref:Uncharacterized protein n=1 Tax=Listeria rustica TaxID=2713503 RepID=A0A7W1T4U8_9LIST|nr:hypothetical protein [Listeria rustica]MBA3925541.1 hypothetical protein [Listeria rustica]
MEYIYLETPIINRFASLHGVKPGQKPREDVIEEIRKIGKEEELQFLNQQYQFSSKHISLWKFPDGFPNNLRTAQQFIDSLVKRDIIMAESINTAWEPPLLNRPQICAIKMVAENVYMTIVEKNSRKVKEAYGSTSLESAKFTSLVIHFGTDQLIQHRCAFSYTKKYTTFIKDLMLLPSEAEPYTFPKTTKKTAMRICELVSAGVISRDIDTPSSIGSITLNGTEGIDLNSDEECKRITEALNEMGLPTDNNNSETCIFNFTEPITSFAVKTKFEINYKRGFYKFSKEMPEFIFDYFWEALTIAEREEQAEILEKA